MRAWALLFLSSCAAETALLARLDAMDVRMAEMELRMAEQRQQMAEKDQQILKLQTQLDMNRNEDKHQGRVLQQQSSADITRIRVDAPNGKSQIVMGDMDGLTVSAWRRHGLAWYLAKSMPNAWLSASDCSRHVSSELLPQSPVSSRRTGTTTWRPLVSSSGIGSTEYAPHATACAKVDDPMLTRELRGGAAVAPHCSIDRTVRLLRGVFLGVRLLRGVLPGVQRRAPSARGVGRGARPGRNVSMRLISSDGGTGALL